MRIFVGVGLGKVLSLSCRCRRQVSVLFGPVSGLVREVPSGSVIWWSNKGAEGLLCGTESGVRVVYHRILLISIAGKPQNTIQYESDFSLYSFVV